MKNFLHKFGNAVGKSVAQKGMNQIEGQPQSASDEFKSGATDSTEGEAARLLRRQNNFSSVPNLIRGIYTNPTGLNAEKPRVNDKSLGKSQSVPIFPPSEGPDPSVQDLRSLLREVADKHIDAKADEKKPPAKTR